jgi:hypothetical protein
VVATIVDVTTDAFFVVFVVVLVVVFVVVFIAVVFLIVFVAVQPSMDASVSTAGSQHLLSESHCRPHRASFGLYFGPPLDPPASCCMLFNSWP